MCHALGRGTRGRVTKEAVRSFDGVTVSAMGFLLTIALLVDSLWTVVRAPALATRPGPNPFSHSPRAGDPVRRRRGVSHLLRSQRGQLPPWRDQPLGGVRRSRPDRRRDPGVPRRLRARRPGRPKTRPDGPARRACRPCRGDSLRSRLRSKLTQLALLRLQQKCVETSREPDQLRRLAHREQRALDIRLGRSPRVMADGQALVG